MDWRNLSQDDLDQWRAAPVAECLREILAHSLKAQQQMAQAAYWGGRAWPEPDRLALIRAAALFDDWWTATADDFKAVMETMTNDQ